MTPEDRGTHGVPGPLDSGPLSYAIFTMARAHRGYAAELLRALDLHPGQELLLMQLLQRDGQTQSELLDSVGLDHSTVSKSLSRMELAGLLTREPAAHDRRVLVVSLTKKGRRLRAPLEAMWTELDRVASNNLDPGEIAELIRLSQKVRQAIADRDVPNSTRQGERPASTERRRPARKKTKRGDSR